MKATNEYVDFIQKLNLRFDDIEKLIKLLLINSLVDETEGIYQREDEVIDSEVKKIVQHHNLEIGGRERIEGINILNILIPKRVSISIKEILGINELIKSIYPDIEPVFKYEAINGMQRKRILQERISFSVMNKEIHIFALERRRK